MIKREEYLAKLQQFREKQLIKVVTGVRRCGKSTLLDLFCEDLISEGVAEEQIIKINFEDIKNRTLTAGDALYTFIESRLISSKMNYIILDEIQNVLGFEQVADSLYIKKNVDLYITGSNAYFLSSELATLLSGRYVEIKMLPLSFKEYISAFNDQSRLDILFNNYMEFGAFPHAVTLFQDDASLVSEYLQGIYDTVFFKDVITRKRINDQGKLQSVIEFMFDNVGNITNPRKIADTMTSMGRKISNHTVESYLAAMEDSFLLYSAGRFDVKGKQLLQTQKKYYLVDTGIRRILSSKPTGTDYGHILENVVYLELLRRGNTVWIGKLQNGEVDFVARSKDGDLTYYQVAYTAREDSTINRELAPLKSIKDNNPKYLITMDVERLNYDGIQKINAIDFLLQ